VPKISEESIFRDLETHLLMAMSSSPLIDPQRKRKKFISHLYDGLPPTPWCDGTIKIGLLTFIGTSSKHLAMRLRNAGQSTTNLWVWANCSTDVSSKRPGCIRTLIISSGIYCTWRGKISLCVTRRAKSSRTDIMAGRPYIVKSLREQEKLRFG
jgi:hypothetical protein